MNLIVYPAGEGTRLYPFHVTGNGHGRVTEPRCDHFNARNLGTIPKNLYFLFFRTPYCVLKIQISESQNEVVHSSVKPEVTFPPLLVSRSFSLACEEKSSIIQNLFRPVHE